jgi:hypothetical protein
MILKFKGILIKVGCKKMGLALLIYLTQKIFLENLQILNILLSELFIILCGQPILIIASFFIILSKTVETDTALIFVMKIENRKSFYEHFAKNSL